MRRVAFLVVTAAGACLAAWPAIAWTITPEKILKAQDDLTYTGLLLINGTQKVQVTHGGGMRGRQAFFNAKGELADLMVSDGHIRWHFSPRMHVVRLMPMDEDVSLQKRLAMLNKNYRFQVLGQARKAGRLVVLTRFTPRNDGNMVHMLWVDPNTNLPLAVERRGGDGKLIDRSEYLRINYRPKLAPKAFEFSIPEGCQVQPSLTVMAHGDASLAPPATIGFRPPLPRQLPPGYQLLSWKFFMANHNVPTFNWRLHDGLNSLSLFAVADRYQPEPPPEAKVLELGRKRAFILDHGANHMLMWKASGVAYTLVGHVPEADMLKVAESTQ
jgi:negative regulator of sigma E activity